VATASLLLGRPRRSSITAPAAPTAGPA